MRSVILLSLLMVAGCQQQQPENGVDTTLPSEPAKISGSLTAPGDYMPSDMQVCVETPAGKTVSCKAKVDNSIYTGSYEIEVQAGSYRVYATTSEVPNYKAYFTKCGTEPNCLSHAPVVVTVEEGETRTGVDPNDWANRPAPPQTLETTNYAEPTYDPDLNMDAAPVDDSSSNAPDDE